MEEVNESTSENNIIVDGIKDFPASPYDVNEKAYIFRMGKGSQNEYSSRLGLNMFKLPDGEYTLAIEFFPPTMDEVAVSVVSASLNTGQQSTKLFPKYSRSIVHLHKYDITPPEYIYIDMECQGITSSLAQGAGHLIVYGIEGKQNDVDSYVYDAVYAVDKGKMVMQTDLDLNGRRALNSFYYLHGYLNTRNGNPFTLNGSGKTLLPQKSIIKEIDVYYPKYQSAYPRLKFRINLNANGTIKQDYDISSPTQYNKLTTKLLVVHPTPFVSVTALSPVPNNAEILMLITYIVP